MNSDEGLRERADMIADHAADIGVRVEIEPGKWESRFLAELPVDLALREAFRLLFREEEPHRRVRPESQPVLGYSRDGDTVTLRMSLDDWQHTLFLLGVATGREPGALEIEVLPLINRICEGHPDFRPYKVEPEGRA